MSNSIAKKFSHDSDNKAFDVNHRMVIKHNISQYNNAVAKGLQQFKNLEKSKIKAALIKYNVLENLDKHLLDFEKRFSENGGSVLWASDEKNALNSVIQILSEHDIKMVVKSKSMITEEIDLTAFLQANGIEAYETDLGEHIVQITGDKPYHIVTPIMHKSAKEISKIFHDKFGLDTDNKPEDITGFVRNKLREKFFQSGAGITGANFLISESGSVVLTENEGNGVMSMSWPKIHIVIAGIEKVIPSINDLHLFLPLLASHGTGQNLTTYNSIVSSSAKSNNGVDGESKMYVILLDNGRTNLLKLLPQRSALSCIRCGACLNGCPVYRNIGGHAYNTVYSGPIGAVITPHLKKFKNYKHLSYASTLCGKCSEVCPVKINLHKLLLYNRRYAEKHGNIPKLEKAAIYLWKKAMLNRWIINKPHKSLKNTFFKHIVGQIWGKNRNAPYMKTKSFNNLWKQKNQNLDNTDFTEFK